MARCIEVNSLRKHLLKDVYHNLPFYIVSGGVKMGVIMSPRAYNRLKMIEELAIRRFDKCKRDSRLIDELGEDTDCNTVLDELYESDC